MTTILKLAPEGSHTCEIGSGTGYGAIWLALRGVRFKPASATALLRRNMLIYGLGGVLLPFVAIKLIDMMLAATIGA